MATPASQSNPLVVAADHIEGRLQRLESSLYNVQCAAATNAGKVIEAKIQLDDSIAKIEKLERTVELLQAK